jgi:lipoate-protein ligase A
MQGPGLLNFSLILQLESAPQLQSITAANEFIMERHRSVFSRLLQAPVEICGHTDLAIGGLKFSGNAQRRKKDCLLFHGSFLLHFDIEMIEKALPMPSKEPTYRYGRSHSAFLMNLKVRPELVKRSLCEAWDAHSPLRRIPVEHIDTLVAGKYSREEWNAKF